MATPDLTSLDSDAFLALLTRASCAGDNHRGPTVTVHSPGFFENGGQGTSSYACADCMEAVASVITGRYGSAAIRRTSRS